MNRNEVAKINSYSGEEQGIEVLSTPCLATLRPTASWGLSFIQQHRHMRDRCIVSTHSLRGLGLYADLIRLDPQQLRDPRLNFFGVRNDLRFGKDQCGIDIGH